MRITATALINTGWRLQIQNDRFDTYYRLDGDGKATFALHDKVNNTLVNIWRGEVPNDH